jgi:cytochrome bd-type quinol oxidase subunit 2
MHRALRLATRASGEARQRAKQTARRAWWAAAAFTLLLALLAAGLDPRLWANFAGSSWADAFPVLALAGLIGVRLWDRKETEVLTYLASAGYICGMLTSAALIALQ